MVREVITVACVLRSGGDYGPDDVARLQAGVAKHLSLPHRFVCLSDVDVDCERIPLTSDWPGWWAKMELFRPDIAGDLLYFDLDTVLTGPLDAIAKVGRFAILRDFYRGGSAFQSSAMFLPEYVRDYVWRQWERDPAGHMKAHRAGGDQAFLETCKLHPAFWQDILPGKFVSYKVHVRHPRQHPRETGNGSVPSGASVVVFHGKPRPRDVGWLSLRRCLILGGAKSVWDDVERALALSEFDAVVATNDAGAHWPGRLDHWCSLHPEKLPRWERERAARGYPGGYVRWSHAAKRGVDRVTSDWRGSSGLFAAKVALELGYSRIVLCGVPMEPEGAHFFDAEAWTYARGYRAAWNKQRPELAERVRSMGGWTTNLIGEPDIEWLNG